MGFTLQRNWSSQNWTAPSGNNDPLAEANGILVALPESEPDQAGSEPDMTGATEITVSTDGTMGDESSADHTTIQAAIDAAIAISGPVRIVLQNGDTFGGNNSMKPKTDDDWILVEPEDPTFLPAYGTRFRPSQSAHAAEFATTWSHDGSEMPVLKPTTTNNRAVLVDDSSGVVGRYWWKGVKMEAGADTSTLTATTYSGSTAADATHHITFDRCWFDGVHDTFNTRRALFGDGAHILVVACTMERMVEPGSDSQAILVQNGPGPMLIEENFLEGASENFMSGGGDSKSAETNPRDITIRRNHLYKDLAWKGASKAVKNIFEIKNAHRVLFEQNVCQNNWQDAQTGKTVLLRAENQSGGTSGEWTESHDITVRWNKYINCEQGYDTKPIDDSPVAEANNANSIHNELWISFGEKSTHSPGSPDDLIIGGSVNGLFIANITMVGASGTHAIGDDGGPTDPAFLAQDCIWGGDEAPDFYNWKADATSQGAPSLDACFGSGDWSVKKNVVIGHANNPTPGTEQGPVSEANVGFVNLAGENYRLDSESQFKGTATDGGDPGCDIDELENNKINGIE